MASTTPNVPIKFVLDDEIRRISVPQETSFDGLLNTLNTIVHTPVFSSERVYSTARVEYVDDEQDVCAITNNAELQEAIRLSSAHGRVLRLLLSRSTRSPQIPKAAAKRRRASASRNTTKNYDSSKTSSRAACAYATACRLADAAETEKAFEHLCLAIRCGFKDTADIMANPCWDNSRRSPAFLALVAHLALTECPRVALMRDIRNFNKDTLKHRQPKVRRDCVVKPSTKPVSPAYVSRPSFALRKEIHSFNKSTELKKRQRSIVPATNASRVALMKEIRDFDRSTLRHQPLPDVLSSWAVGRVLDNRRYRRAHAKVNAARTTKTTNNNSGSESTRVALMREIRAFNRSSLRHQPTPAVLSCWAVGRVIENRRHNGRAPNTNAKPNACASPDSRLALMREVLELQAKGLKPCPDVPCGHKVAELTSHGALMQELTQNKPALKHRSEPSKVLTGRPGLIQEIENSFSTPKSLPDHPAKTIRFQPNRQPHLKEIQNFSKDNQLKDELPKPNRLPFLSNGRPSFSPLPFHTAHQSLMRELRLRIVLKY